MSSFPFFMNNIGIPQGWSFSAVNSAMLCNSPFDMTNVLWNQLNEKSASQALNYFYPSCDTLSCLPFGTISNNDYLLDPRLVFAQMQNKQNNDSIFGFGSFNFNNAGFDWSNPFGSLFNNIGGNNNGTNNNSNTRTQAEIEYKNLKDVFDKILKAADKGDIDLGSARELITKALKEGKTTEEKLKALKDAYNAINDKEIFQAAIFADSTIKKDLQTIGYAFDETFETEEDAKKRAEKEDLLRTISQDLNDDSKKSNEKISSLSSASADMGKDMVEYTSLWNKTHTKDQSLIRMIANKMPEREDEKELWKNAMANLANGLVSQAKKIKGKKNMPKLEADQKALEEAIDKANSEFNKTNIQAVADKFDTLYARIRMTEAVRIRGVIKDKYGFMDEINPTGQKIVDDNTIVKSIADELDAQGMPKIELSDVDVVTTKKISCQIKTTIDDEYNTPEEKINAMKDKNIKETLTIGVFETKVENGEKKFYTIKKDANGNDKLVELKNVKSIDAEGNCKMLDGTTKKVEEVETEEVNAQNIIDYHTTAKQVSDLLSSNAIHPIKSNQTYKGHTIYASKGKDINGKQQFFIVKNNKLVLLKDAKWNSSAGKLEGFEDSSMEEISESSILTTDKQKEAKEAEEAKKAEEKKKAERSEEEKIVEEDNGAYDLGYDVAEDLIGRTTKDEYTNVSNTLKVINKDNVIDFLKGYYSNCSGGNGLFLQIATENKCTLTREEVTKVMKAAIEAVPSELRKTEQFRVAQRIYRKYAKEAEKNPNDIFKLIGQGAWGWSRIWGTDDLDQFDDALEDLFGLGDHKQIELEDDFE